MNFFSSLFQSKNHLPPFFRSLAIYLETQLVGIALAAFMAASQYFAGHQQIDAASLLNFIYASVAISVAKALTGLVPQIQVALTAQANAAQPPIVIHNNMPTQPATPVQQLFPPSRSAVVPNFTAPQQVAPPR